MTYEKTLRMRRMPRLVRWWQGRRGGPVTEASAHPWWWHWFAWVMPFRLRPAHRWYARRRGLFWLPCPLCGVDFGGHEWRSVDGRVASVPDPTGPQNVSVGICPRCTRAGRGAAVDLGDWGTG